MRVLRMLRCMEVETPTEMERLFQINFFSAVRCSSKALPLLRAQGTGRIINVSSVVAHKPSFGTSGYAASKSALEGYARGSCYRCCQQGYCREYHCLWLHGGRDAV